MHDDVRPVCRADSGRRHGEAAAWTGGVGVGADVTGQRDAAAAHQRRPRAAALQRHRARARHAPAHRQERGNGSAAAVN